VQGRYSSLSGNVYVGALVEKNVRNRVLSGDHGNL
jgi:hypothetical protein